MSDRGSEASYEQRAIIELPAETQVIVIAGPGTGKTHTLVRRVHTLLTRDIAASEILVLSFTNAVVGELQRRFAELEESDAGFVRPVTIDSFAGRVVRSSTTEQVDIGFNETVKRATALIQEDRTLDAVRHYRHVIVDEAQDLVTVRLEFVAAILQSAGCGFTVLGDPAQGIYGFTNSENGHRSAIDALVGRFPKTSTMRLTHDYRSVSSEAAPGHRVRDVVLNGNGEDPLVAVTRVLRGSDRLTPAQLATVLRRSDATTAVLCRTNGEVLFLSGLMAEAGVKHSVRRGAADATPPAWVARYLKDLTSSEISRDRFAELTAQSEDWIALHWKALLRLAGNRSGRVAIQRLRERLSQLTFEEAPDEAGSVPVLSTVHRSKGLEYDTVVVLEPEGWSDLNSVDAAEEARVYYVALTRARSRTVRLARPEIPGRLTRRRGRSVVMPWRGSRPSHIELRIGDVAGTLDEIGRDEVEAEQNYLRDKVHAGDPVTLRLLVPHRTYGVEHNGQRIATTGSAFEPFADRQPRLIDRVRVDCLRSAAGDPARTANLGLGAGGFWLVPEIIGLGRLTWEDLPT